MNEKFKIVIVRYYKIVIYLKLFDIIQKLKQLTYFHSILKTKWSLSASTKNKINNNSNETIKGLNIVKGENYGKN